MSNATAANAGAAARQSRRQHHGPRGRARDARHEVGIAILRAFADAGIDFAYPTQTTFTAAPDGTLVMPYAEQAGMGSTSRAPRTTDA